ncbi:hypothetical protein Hypma_009873 [Hypsizygus marmoreus]|uniref:Uncharacterized protein n=1 Tax=Hypsizygus marmoreus TaxID=39966 RepID=A0A369JLI1_HYPMA|nr:hypothetical protein Hypma_009873 [Hypsizygus marmoreus]
MVGSPSPLIAGSSRSRKSTTPSPSPPHHSPRKYGGARYQRRLLTLTRGDHESYPIVLSDHDEQNAHGDHDEDPIVISDDESAECTPYNERAANGRPANAGCSEECTAYNERSTNGRHTNTIPAFGKEGCISYTSESSVIGSPIEDWPGLRFCISMLNMPNDDASTLHTCLSTELREIRYLRRHRQDVYNCCEVPTSRAHLSYLVGVLKDHGVHRPQSILAYPCPLCKYPVAFPPVEAIEMRNFISEIQGALNITPAESELANEAGVTTIGYFEGLFLEDI